MSDERKEMFCECCFREVEAVRKNGVSSISHVCMALLTLISCGLSLIFWVLAANICHYWQCPRCGYKIKIEWF